MSRHDLLDFIISAEHSFSLREKIKGCKNEDEILSLAKSYGFLITTKDLIDDKESEKINEWFINSKIPPIKKS